MEHAVSVQGLVKSYGGTRAVDRVSFDVTPGETFGLLGANGAGKTTTLECLLGVRRPDAGNAAILGMDPRTQRKELFQRVGVQFQEARYQDKITVDELCRATCALYREADDPVRLLARFGLADVRAQAVESLSGGQRQRLFVVLALIPRPEVVFLDELTTGLDVKARRDVWRLLREMRQQGMTIVLTSHFMDEVEELCDRVAIMRAGRIVSRAPSPRPWRPVRSTPWRRRTLRTPSPPTLPKPPKEAPVKAFSTLLAVELRLSLRDMNMPIFAAIMPVVVMLVIGMLFGGQPAHEGADYTFVAQSVGAVSAIGICAGGAMGLPLVVSNYRYRKILKRYFVTPVSAGMILAVQVAVYTVYALVSAVLVFAVAALLFGYSFTGSWPAFAGSYALVCAAMLALGMMVGGLAPNEKVSGVLASVLYFPMLLLSGTTLPYEVLPTAVQRAADLLPLTQGVKLLKDTSLGLPLDQAIVPVLVLAAWTIVCTAVAVRFFKWE